MKKTTIALALLFGLTGTAYANLSNQVEEMTKVTQPAPEAQVAQTEEKPEIKEVKFVDAKTELDNLRQEVLNSDVVTTLDKDAQAKSSLLFETTLTKILEQKFAQESIIDNKNKMINEQYKRELGAQAEKAKVEEKQVMEEMQQQELAAPPVITDAISVLSVYGTNNNLFAEIKVNNNKYQVQAGQKFGDGYTASQINRDGVKVVKQDVEQFINVSANPTTVSVQAEMVPQNIPNVIKPYELR